MTESIRVLGYVRVSTEEQKLSGLSVEAQRQTIRLAADARGWQLTHIHEDLGSSGRSTHRPALQAALELLAKRPRKPREYDALIVTKLDRLTRSVLDFARLLDAAERAGWKVVILDLGVDTSTPHGEMVANCMAIFAQFERQMIGQRTRDALAAKKARGESVGRPIAISPELEARIVAMVTAGSSYFGVAQTLTAEQVIAPRGGSRWHDSTIRKVLARHPEVEKRLSRGRRPKIATG